MNNTVNLGGVELAAPAGPRFRVIRGVLQFRICWGITEGKWHRVIDLAGDQRKDAANAARCHFLDLADYWEDVRQKTLDADNMESGANQGQHALDETDNAYKKARAWADWGKGR